MFKQLMMVLAIAAPMMFAAEAVVSPGQKKIFIAPMGGFETAISAAIYAKRVPAVVVTDREQADYVLEGVASSQKAGWAKIIFAGDLRSSEEASVRLVDTKTSAVLFAYNVNKSSSWRGRQSSSESCAKYLKKFLEGR